MSAAEPKPKRWPLTDEQRRARRQEFIDSIDTSAVCSLASRHNDSKPCQVFREPASGSFNLCFFVEFPSDGTKWVVRIPVKPAVANPWQKIESEVATLRYLEKRTKIPVPHVHTCGAGGPPDEQNPTGQPYMIIDYIGDKSLDLHVFIKAPVEQRKRFYAQLIDILAELRQQEFSYAGSLFPGSNNGGDPILGPSLSIELNELQSDHGEPILPGVRFSSAIDFAFHHWHIKAKVCEEPVSERTLSSVQTEMYAIEDFEGRISSFIDLALNHGPFVLSHPDLRWTNIMVDDNLNIKGIVDWEFSGTVPRQFFIPPTWLAATNAGEVSLHAYREAYEVFYEVLLNKSSKSEWCGRLAEEWGPDLPQREDMNMAVALLRHGDFIKAYYLGIYQKFHKIERKQAVLKFFEQDAPDGRFYKLAQQRFEQCQEYDQYLKDNGLFVHDKEIDYVAEQLRKRKEQREKTENLLARLDRQREEGEKQREEREKKRREIFSMPPRDQASLHAEGPNVKDPIMSHIN